MILVSLQNGTVGFNLIVGTHSKYHDISKLCSVRTVFFVIYAFSESDPGSEAIIIISPLIVQNRDQRVGTLDAFECGRAILKQPTIDGKVVG